MYGYPFHLLWYHGELQRCCGPTEWQGLELVCPTLDVKSQVFPGLFLYRYMDIGIPPSTVVLPRVQPPKASYVPKKGLVWNLKADCVPHLGHLVF